MSLCHISMSDTIVCSGQDINAHKLFIRLFALMTQTVVLTEIPRDILRQEKKQPDNFLFDLFLITTVYATTLDKRRASAEDWYVRCFECLISHIRISMPWAKRDKERGWALRRNITQARLRATMHRACLAGAPAIVPTGGGAGPLSFPPRKTSPNCRRTDGQ